MALLREQANLIRVLKGFQGTPLSKFNREKDIKVNLSANLGGMQDARIPNYLEDKLLFVGEKTVKILEKESSEYWERRTKVANLYQSCKDDKFITPFEINLPTKIGLKGDLIDLGVRITSRGSDLLHPLGFITIALEKYTSIQLILSSSLVGALITFILTRLL